jgi:hypothetical protein
MAIGWRAPDPACPPAKAYSAALPRPAPGCPAHSQSPAATNTSCVVPAPLKSARRRAVSNSTKCCRAFSSRRARPRRSGPSWLLVASLTSSTQHPAWSCAGTSHSWCVARAAQRGGGGQGVCQVVERSVVERTTLPCAPPSATPATCTHSDGCGAPVPVVVFCSS